jgi:ankyrin repeat protein
MCLSLLYRADVNSRNEEENTAIHFAAKISHLQTINELIRFGASLILINLNNETPYDIAQAMLASVEVLKALDP